MLVGRGDDKIRPKLRRVELIGAGIDMRTELSRNKTALITGEIQWRSQNRVIAGIDCDAA